MATHRPPNIVLRLALRIESLLDDCFALFKKPLGADQPLHIIAFLGFGNSKQATLSGRVLLRKKRSTGSSNSRYRNLRNNYAHFNTDEVKGVTVQGRLGESLAAAESDEEGYFSLSFDTTHVLLNMQQALIKNNDLTVIPSYPVELSVPGFPDVSIEGIPEIIVPTDKAQFGIISDVDDTLLITKATSLLSMLKLTLFGSAQSRQAYPGIADLYAALHNKINPIFYVSSSPWNLYIFLMEFMQHHGFKAGPIMLRDFGLDESKFIAGSHKDHKLAQIQRVLECYPELSFILSGDSGQDDAEIYTHIAQQYPGRIKTIYIRDVGQATARLKVQKLAEQMASQNIDMLLIDNTLQAATHAAQKGFINAEVLEKVKTLENENY
ncbi:MAG: App1 family protein [Granulosicoccus sp.]